MRLSAHQTELYSTKFLVVFLCLFEGFVEKAEDYNKRGKVECEEGRFEKACQQFTSALKCLPSNVEDDKRLKYLCNRAGCYLKLVCLTLISSFSKYVFSILLFLYLFFFNFFSVCNEAKNKYIECGFIVPVYYSMSICITQPVTTTTILVGCNAPKVGMIEVQNCGIVFFEVKGDDNKYRYDPYNLYVGCG